jgi:CHAT domain-containing protein
MGTVGSGMSGSTFALLRAGCKAVIAAKWRVNDLAIAVLMERLHRGLAEGTSAAESLACAQRNMAGYDAQVIATNVRKWLKASSADLERGKTPTYWDCLKNQV